MRATVRALLVFLIFVPHSGGARRSAAPVPPPPSAADPVKTLRTDLDKIFSDTRVSQTELGVEVFSIDRSETLYEMNSQRLLMPASGNKLIPAAVALVRLGPDYRFETRVLTNGEVENGMLNGDLIIAGSGDPTNSEEFQTGGPFAVFRNWAARLREMNIRAISGAILGDDSAFEEPKPGFGWEWNDLTYDYAAPTGALQFNNNVLTLQIDAGAQTAGPALIRTNPLESYLNLNNHILTGPEGSPGSIRIVRGDLPETLDAFGAIPAKGRPVLETVAVQRPTYFYISALKYVLSQEGISADRLKVSKKSGNSGIVSLLWTQHSPELSEIIKPLLKKSVNLYAETLVHALGLRLRGEGTFAKGKEVVQETLGEMGIPAGGYSFADGSGLSRLNLESPDSLVRLLRFMHKNRNFQDFYEALPIAAVDGTLSARMKGTAAADNVRAKTGTMSHVSSISGYMRTADGEMLAFSIMANNFPVAPQLIESMQDRALERLASFSRK